MRKVFICSRMRRVMMTTRSMSVDATTKNVSEALRLAIGGRTRSFVDVNAAPQSVQGLAAGSLPVAERWRLERLDVYAHQRKRWPQTSFFGFGAPAGRAWAMILATSQSFNFNGAHTACRDIGGTSGISCTVMSAPEAS